MLPSKARPTSNGGHWKARPSQTRAEDEQIEKGGLCFRFRTMFCFSSLPVHGSHVQKSDSILDCFAQCHDSFVSGACAPAQRGDRDRMRKGAEKEGGCDCLIAFKDAAARETHQINPRPPPPRVRGESWKPRSLLSCSISLLGLYLKLIPFYAHIRKPGCARASIGQS